MDMAISIFTMTGQQLKRVNAVREYFNVFYLSEVSTADGKALIPGIDSGRSIHQRYQPTKIAPKQARPGRRSFDLWWQVLSKFTRNKSMMLETPLGEWTEDHSTNGIWTFYELEDKVFEYVVPVVDTPSNESTDSTVVSSVTTVTELDDDDTDDDQSLDIDTSVKHWNVYVKHGTKHSDSFRVVSAHKKNLTEFTQYRSASRN